MQQEESETITVSEDEVGMRVDKFLALRYPEQSRTYFQYLIEEKLVLINGEPIKKREKLKLDDEIEVEFALTPELSLEPENIPLDIVYEDEYIIVINKPVGLVVHPAPGNWSHTFVNALLYHCKHLKDVGEPLRPGIVHRLDKETSGLLVAAKTKEAHQKLVALFASRSIYKEYLAICIGIPEECVITTHIARHPIHRKKMCNAQTGGKLAITRCYPIAKLNCFSLVQCILESGRTHQIRLHMQAKHAPILGDSLYGNEGLNKKHSTTRQLLHAYRLGLKHPITEKPLLFEAPIPKDMLTIIQKTMPCPHIPIRSHTPSHSAC
ncbi:MAG: RluA family pseudouridine synthase [Chlamydiales bacterium]|nr:RluA family pseudouridine synthase [Chlamydiales bacterium]